MTVALSRGPVATGIARPASNQVEALNAIEVEATAEAGMVRVAITSAPGGGVSPMGEISAQRSHRPSLHVQPRFRAVATDLPRTVGPQNVGVGMKPRLQRSACTSRTLVGLTTPNPQKRRCHDVEAVGSLVGSESLSQGRP